MVLVVAALVVGYAAVQVLDRPSVIRVPGSALIDQPAPAFALERLDGGGMLRLSDFRGRPVVVNFWASWCIPCREEFPILRDMRERYADNGLEVIGIVHDDGPEAARRFAADFDADWPMVVDPDDVAWNAYNAQLVPMTYFIDRDGIVRAVSFGPPPPAVLDEQLAKIL